MSTRSWVWAQITEDTTWLAKVNQKVAKGWSGGSLEVASSYVPSMFAPALMSNLTMASQPFWHAMYRGV